MRKKTKAIANKIYCQGISSHELGLINSNLLETFRRIEVDKSKPSGASESERGRQLAGLARIHLRFSKHPDG